MLLPWIHSCVGEVNTAKRIADEFGGKLLPMKYAKGFKVYEKKGVKRILILNPIDSTEVLGDIIVEPRSKRGVAQYSNSIKVPLERTYRDWETDRKSTRLNSSHITRSRMPSSA